MTILNSKFEFNRCLIPTLVTDDPKPKPYQQNQIKFNRDPDDQEDEYWDDDDNPNKRPRTQDIRRRNPAKKQKPNQPDEEPNEETRNENKGEKRKPKQREDRPTKARRVKFKTSHENHLEEGKKADQTKTSYVSPNQNHILAPPTPSQPNRNQNLDQEELTDKHNDNVLNLTMPSTLPQSNQDLSTDCTKTDGISDLPSEKVKFMGLLRREGSIIKNKKKPKRKIEKGRFNFKCQDIRKFYTYKLQQPPPPRSTKQKGRFQ